MNLAFIQFWSLVYILYKKSIIGSTLAFCYILTLHSAAFPDQINAEIFQILYRIMLDSFVLKMLAAEGM